jgi:hypothetical protein
MDYIFKITFRFQNLRLFLEMRTQRDSKQNNLYSIFELKEFDDFSQN